MVVKNELPPHYGYISEKQKPIILPIMQQTIENYERIGTVESFEIILEGPKVHTVCFCEIRFVTEIFLKDFPNYFI